MPCHTLTVNRSRLVYGIGNGSVIKAHSRPADVWHPFKRFDVVGSGSSKTP